MKRFTLALLIALQSSVALATPVIGPAKKNELSVTVSAAAFTALALDAPKTTDYMIVQGWRRLTFELEFTHNSATAVTMTCSASEASGGTYKPLQVLSFVGATANSDTMTWSQAVAGDEDWVWTVNLNEYRYLKCTFSGTGAAASDTLTIKRAVVAN